METIGVAGSGSFGTAMSHMLAHAGYKVVLWCHDSKDASYINENHVNPKHFSDVKLDGIEATASFESFANVDSVILAVPSFGIRPVAREMAAHVSKTTPVLVLSKGLDRTSGSPLYQTVAEEMDNVSRVAVLCGPNHAEELIIGIYAGAVVASERMETAKYFQKLVSNDFFRTYISPDPLGVSICGASKNVIAIACGAARGLGYGDNTVSLLITRGLAEIRRLVMACGGNEKTCMGLAGIGDLNVTCCSRHSRNGMYGEALADGKTVSEYEKERGMIVEGAHSVDALLELGHSKWIELPIMEVVKSLLDQECDMKAAIGKLMDRDLKPEF